MKLISTLRQITKYQNKFRSVLDKKSCTYLISLKLFAHTESLSNWGKNKKHRNVKLQWYFETMADSKVEQILAPLRASVKEQVSKFFLFNKLFCLAHFNF